MARTAQLDLPLVMPAQAQKHVTVNEAFARLDAATQLRVVSSAITAPPATGVEGSSFLIPEAATGEWQSMAGRIAVRSNGGWVYLTPKAGWRAWDESRYGYLMFDGSVWIADAVAVSPSGAATGWRVVEFDHVIVPGATNLSSVVIPNQAQVVGVTGRVVEGLYGPGLTSWRIGVVGSDNRYGSGLAIGMNSYVVGLSGAPVTYYSPTPLLVSAEAGTLGGGKLRLALHFLQLQPPRAL
jgi:Protein of unknown function (DUF2793)